MGKLNPLVKPTSKLDYRKTGWRFQVHLAAKQSDVALHEKSSK